MKRVLLLVACSLHAQNWTQLGQNAAHTGQAAVAGQKLAKILASFQYDALADAIRADEGGDLLVHYMAPLVDGNDVFMMTRTGQWVSCTDEGIPCGTALWNQMTWSVAKLSWVDGELKQQWTTATTWKPTPDNGSGWEPLFHPALFGGFVYAPAANGALMRIDRTSGEGILIDTFGADGANVYATGPVTADASGNLFYNTMRLDVAEPWRGDVTGAWLVRVGADGAVTKTAFAALAAGAPRASDGCIRGFGQKELPWPPSPTAVPSSKPCGSQRPGLNVGPAIAPDGTIYTVSRAHFNSQYGYLIAANPDMTPKWAASFRDRLNDGCGVLVNCRVGALQGVDPATNLKPAGAVSDQSTASPAVAPDGAILYGALTRYNSQRGHLMKFSAAGEFLAAFDFGWDNTPAIYAHDGTYSVLLKNNHYGIGSYCDLPEFCPPDSENYELVSLDANLKREWGFLSTNSQACERQADGTLKCVSKSNGFEWCVNMVAIDKDGTMYANSEDGNVYAVNREGKLVGNIFLKVALGAAYTPLAIGGDGRIYTQNAGVLFVVGEQ